MVVLTYTQLTFLFFLPSPLPPKFTCFSDHQDTTCRNSLFSHAHIFNSMNKNSPSGINLNTITMNANKQALKLPGASKVRGKQPAGDDQPPSSTAVTMLHQKDLDALLKKGNFLDLSSPSYLLESDEFLLYCPNVIKELDLSSNALIQLSSLKACLFLFSPTYLSIRYIISILFMICSFLYIYSCTIRKSILYNYDTTFTSYFFL